MVGLVPLSLTGLKSRPNAYTEWQVGKDES
jgi:hypothetical protein